MRGFGKGILVTLRNAHYLLPIYGIVSLVVSNYDEQRKTELKQQTSGLGPSSESRLLEFLIQIGRACLLAADSARKQARREVCLTIAEDASTEAVRAAVEARTETILSAMHPQTQTIMDFGDSYKLCLEMDSVVALQACTAAVLSLPVCHLKHVLEILKDSFISGQSFLYRYPEHMKVRACQSRVDSSGERCDTHDTHDPSQVELPKNTTRWLAEKRAAIFLKPGSGNTSPDARQFETFRMYLEILEDSELEKSIGASAKNDDRPLADVLVDLCAFEMGNPYHEDMKGITPPFVMARPHFAHWFQRIYTITMSLRNRVAQRSGASGQVDGVASLAKLEIWNPNENWGAPSAAVSTPVVVVTPQPEIHVGSQPTGPLPEPSGAEETKVVCAALISCLSCLVSFPYLFRGTGRLYCTQCNG
jgi:hypothetical protein